jgi:hypothetical protein
MSASRRALAAGALYFLIVFACAFVLGTIRVLWILPAMGPLVAVLLELPLVLLLSWWVSGSLIRRLAVPPTVLPRLLMGGLAFALLMLAELLLAVFAFGQTSADFLAGLATMAGLVGLSGQIVFGLMPLIRAQLLAR